MAQQFMDLDIKANVDQPHLSLGLSIVDAVMSAHGGYVSVKSKLGEGSTFTLHFLNQE